MKRYFFGWFALDFASVQQVDILELYLLSMGGNDQGGNSEWVTGLVSNMGAIRLLKMARLIKLALGCGQRRV